MARRWLVTVACAGCVQLAAQVQAQSERNEASADDSGSWPGFRGRGDSTTHHDALPLRWSDDSNIAWRMDLGGYGQSSPVIFGGRVFVTSTDGEHKERLLVEAYSLKDGIRLWRKEFVATQKADTVSGMISRGAPTPLADESGVYAFFESGDLLALDRDGELRWKRQLTVDYGNFIGGHGIGTSPVFAPGCLLLAIDHDGPSYLLCLDRSDGSKRWKVDREPRVSWTTPLFLEHDGVEQVAISSNGVIEAFRLSDGERLWWMESVEGNTVASPSHHGDLLVVGSSAPRNSMAIRLGGAGKLSSDARAWVAQSVTSSFGSPLIHGDTVFFVNRSGALQATDLGDGSLRWERRLPASCWASPLSAGGRLYFFCKNGDTVVLDGSGTPESEPAELAVNSLAVDEKDRVYGFAVAVGRFVLRTSRQLICVSE